MSFGQPPKDQQLTNLTLQKTLTGCENTNIRTKNLTACTATISGAIINSECATFPQGICTPVITSTITPNTTNWAGVVIQNVILQRVGNVACIQFEFGNSGLTPIDSTFHIATIDDPTFYPSATIDIIFALGPPPKYVSLFTINTLGQIFVKDSFNQFSAGGSLALGTYITV
jgi:hypothetical protein